MHNESNGWVAGPVVQAGLIQSISLAGFARAETALPPRQLPLAVRDFTGRAEHLAALDALLPSDDVAGSGTGAVVISALDGTAGVGKTTLAVFWAHRVQGRFPDGTLYINLRGYGPGEPAIAAEVLDGFLRALGVPAERIPAGVEAQAGLYRTVLAGRRVLIVLDNANAAEQVRPLLPGAPGCLVLVTSRASLTGLVIGEAATRITLGLFTPIEALDLVRGIVGAQRAEAEPDAVTELIRVCARLPLGLRIASSLITARPRTAVAEVLTDMAHGRHLEVLSRSADERTAVRAVFDWSYTALPEPQARMFRRLGLHIGPELSVHAAAAVGEVNLAVARRLLDDLAEVHLIELVDRDRYRFHDLLRAYAAERARHDDTPADRDDALRALLSWYAHTAHTADDFLFPAHDRPDCKSAPTATPIPVTDRAQGLVWVNTEQENLLAGLRYAAHYDLPHIAVDLAAGTRFLVLRGRWQEGLDAQGLGLVAARKCGDRAAETYFHMVRGEVHQSLYRWEDAIADLELSLAIARDLNDPFQQAWALNQLGRVFLRRGRFGDALGYVLEALPLSRGTDSGRLEAVVEGNVSRTCTGLGRYEQALEHAERGLLLRRQSGDLNGETAALCDAALAWQGLGSHHTAVELLQNSIALGRTLDSPQENAEPLDALGALLQRTGDTTGAAACWREAATIFEEFGDRRAEAVRVRLREL